MMDDSGSYSARKYYSEHPEEVLVEYELHSEAVFDVSRDSQTVKVLEGSVTAKNKGENVEVKEGEKFTSRNVNDFKKPDVKPYSYREETMWWTSGFSQKCKSDYEQTPYPGCSCLKPPSTTGGAKGCCAPALSALIAFATAAITKRLIG